MLNTFFPMVVSALIVLINRERSFRANLLLAVGAGAAMYLFNWWYQQPAFFLIYLLFIAAYLFLLRFPWKQAGWLLLAFTLASGPQYVLESVASVQVFLNAYFFPKLSGQIVWPDILTTITEAQRQDLATNLRRLHGFLPVVFAGLAGLIALFALRWKRLLPIAPLILIGLWSLTGPRRFSMYLAPFIGIGVGVLIELLVRTIGERLQLRPLVLPVVSVALMAAVFFSTSGYTAYNVIPGAIPTAATTRAFLEIKRLVPKHSAMFTWWDQGYPLMDIGGFATYHDGALHGYSRTTLTAKALVSPRQEEMVSLLSYLEDYGFAPLQERIENGNLSGDRMMELVFKHPPDFRGENVHVLYVENMLQSFRGISVFGTWDFNRQTSEPMQYDDLSCFSLIDNILSCQEVKADLNRGIISDNIDSLPLKAVLFIDDGYVVNRIDYPHQEGHYLQILRRKGRVIKVQVLEERLFLTNFNQQYLLGNYDRRYFEEVYNNFPVARVLRVKKTKP
jgi:dolichyl-diphosphooligosaccharide--protein glycosyltransferase